MGSLEHHESKSFQGANSEETAIHPETRHSTTPRRAAQNNSANQTKNHARSRKQPDTLYRITIIGRHHYISPLALMARNFACTDLVVNVLPNRTVISSAISEAVMPDWKSSISNSVHSNFHDAMPYHAYGSPVMLGKGGGKTVRVGSAWSLMGAWDVGT